MRRTLTITLTALALALPSADAWAADSAQKAPLKKIIVAKSTGVSGVRSSARKIGNTVAIDDTSNCATHVAVNNPSAPPASDSIKPCTSSWRTILDRVPPMARRIAISF